MSSGLGISVVVLTFELISARRRYLRHRAEWTAVDEAIQSKPSQIWQLM